MKKKNLKIRLNHADGETSAIESQKKEMPQVDLPSVTVGKKSGLLGDMDINAKIDLPRTTILTIGGVVVFCAIFIFGLIITRDLLKKKVLK